MQLTEILGKNIELTEAIKDYVADKLGSVAKLTEKFEPCDVQAEVGKTTQHHKKGDVFRCEFNLTIPGTKLRSEAVMDDLYAAIDKAADELRRQVKKYKEKMIDADRVRMETTVMETREDWEK